MKAPKVLKSIVCSKRSEDDYHQSFASDDEDDEDDQPDISDVDSDDSDDVAADSDDSDDESKVAVETPGSNLSAFRGVQRLVGKHRARRQAEDEAAAAAEAAAEALGKDLEAMGYDLDCNSFIKRGQTSTDDEDERYSLLGEQSDDDVDVIMSLRSASDVVIASRQALLKEHVESLPDIQTSFLADSGDGATTLSMPKTTRKKASIAVVDKVMEATVSMGSSTDASSDMGPELPTPSVAPSKATLSSRGTKGTAASKFLLKEELDDDNNFQFIVNNSPSASGRPNTTTIRNSGEYNSVLEEEEGSARSNNTSQNRSRRAKNNTPLHDKVNDLLAGGDEIASLEKEPRKSRDSSHRFFPRSTTGLSFRSGVTKSFKARRSSKDDPSSTSRPREPQKTESSVSLNNYDDNSISNRKKELAEQVSNAVSFPVHSHQKSVKLSREASSQSQAKSMASFWTRGSRPPRGVVTTKMVETETRDDRTDASSYVSYMSRTQDQLFSMDDLNDRSEDLNDRSEVLSQALNTEAGISQLSAPGTVHKTRSSRTTGVFSQLGIPPAATGATSLQTSDNLDRLVKSLERNSGGFASEPKEVNNESGSKPATPASAVFIDGMDVIQPRAKSPSVIGEAEDDDNTAIEKETAARKIIELNGAEVQRRAQRALRKKMTRDKLRDLATERSQKIRDFATLSPGSTPIESIRSALHHPTTTSATSLSRALRSEGTNQLSAFKLTSENSGVPVSEAIQMSDRGNEVGEKLKETSVVHPSPSNDMKSTSSRLFSFRSFSHRTQRRQQNDSSESTIAHDAPQGQIKSSDSQCQSAIANSSDDHVVGAVAAINEHPTVPKWTDAPSSSLGFFRGSESPQGSQLHVETPSRENPTPTVDTCSSPAVIRFEHNESNDAGSIISLHKEPEIIDDRSFASQLTEKPAHNKARAIRMYDPVLSSVPGPKVAKKRVKFSMFKKRSKEDSVKSWTLPQEELDERTTVKSDAALYTKFVATVEGGSMGHDTEPSNLAEMPVSLHTVNESFADFGSFVSEEGVEIVERSDDDTTKSLFLYPSLMSFSRRQAGPILSKIEEEDSQIEENTVATDPSRLVDNASLSLPPLMSDNPSYLYDNVEMSFSSPPSIGEMTPHFGSDDHVEPTFEIVLGSRDAFSPVGIPPSHSSMVTSPDSVQVSTVLSKISAQPSYASAKPSPHSTTSNFFPATSSVGKQPDHHHTSWNLRNFFAVSPSSNAATSEQTKTSLAPSIRDMVSTTSSANVEKVPNHGKSWFFAAGQDNAGAAYADQLKSELGSTEMQTVVQQESPWSTMPIVKEMVLSDDPDIESTASSKSAGSTAKPKSLFESVDKWFNGIPNSSQQFKAVGSTTSEARRAREEIEVQRTRSLLDQRRSSEDDVDSGGLPVIAKQLSGGSRTRPTQRMSLLPPISTKRTPFPLLPLKADPLTKMTRVGSIPRREPSDESRISRKNHEATMDYLNAQLKEQEEHSFPSALDPTKNPESAALHRRTMDPPASLQRIPSSLFLDKKDNDESSCLTSLQSTLASRKHKASDSSTVYTFGQADATVWDEIANASYVVEQAMMRVGRSSVSGGKADSSVGDEVETALLLLKRHAERLGVKESELLLAVHSHEETEQSTTSVDDHHSRGEDEIRVVLTTGYTDTFSVDESEKSLTLGEELVEALRTYLAPQNCVDKRKR